MSVPYPVAASAEGALHAPIGCAAREREASAVAHGRVAFVTEWMGPAFASREAAADAYAAAADAAWCAIRPIAAEGAAPGPPAEPVNREGSRWAAVSPAPGVRWRLAVTYWKTGAAAEAETVGLEPARRLRRHAASAGGLDPGTLRRLTDQPLRPVRPQQPLDIGLFETRLPERPDRIVPDD